MKRQNYIIPAAVVCAFMLMCWTLLTIGEEEVYVETPRNRVAMILNGSAQDRGFTQALHEAAASVCASQGLDFASHDGIPGGEPFRDLADRLIGEGYSLILCDSEAYDRDLAELAREQPRVCFLNAMGTVKAHNLASCMRRTYQARYLNGIVAGLQTETDALGYVVSSLSQETIRQLNAFALGARRVNPDARIYVRCTGDQYDEARAASVMGELLDAHPVDVVSIHAVPVSALEAANRRGVWTMGCNIHGENPFPDTWLTGYTFNWEPFYAERIAEWRENRFVGRQYRGGMRNGLVSQSPLSALVKPGVQEAVDEVVSRLMDGSFDVFFGPVTDAEGVVRVREGETLSDERILHGMDWYVEGVRVE